MKVENISEKKLSFLDKINLPSNILNTESEIFIFESKNKWDKDKKVFKKLYIDEGEVFSNKLYIINEEINKSDDIDIEELILPDHLVSVKEKVSGFTSELIRGVRDIKMLNSEKSFINELTLRINRLNESRYSMVDIDRNYGLLSGFNRDLSDLLLIVLLVLSPKNQSSLIEK